jgi:hypothetical protein
VVPAVSIDILTLPPHIRVANYNTNQCIARYRGNRLIEALPAPMTESELLESLRLEPDFSEEARAWDSHMRIHELLGLTNFMVPLAAHVQLARVIDSMMREGYVGRRPMTRDQVAIYQHIHSLERDNKPFRQSADTLTPQLSTALVGVSGMGKTTTVKRVLAHIPPVYYHPELDLYQVTYLHFEMPSDGRGTKSLATGIIERLDQLIPNSNYYDQYVAKSRASGDVLIRVAARLMNKHSVGLLIADEVQNIANARKDEQILMSELTSLCNQCKVPQLYIGTNKANKILGLDFRQARRSLGLGLGDWGPMPQWEHVARENGTVERRAGEWFDLVTELWKYQWVRTPVPLTDGMLNLFYDCTQGVIDLAIKLFMVAQARAILDQSETLSEQLMLDVYKKDLYLIHPMVDALRSGDMKALRRYEDITPPSAADLVADLERRYRAQRIPAASTRPGAEDFELRLASAAQVLGLPAQDAAALASEINADGTAKNMFDAAAQLAKKVAPLKPVNTPKRTKAKESAELELPDLTDRPFDYRNAVVLAFRERTSVVQQLAKLGMAPDPEELVCLG